MTTTLRRGGGGGEKNEMAKKDWESQGEREGLYEHAVG